MCLILFAWNAHPRYRLVVAANRDEFHRRRTRALSRWSDDPVIAGRDVLAGGTWMGVHAGAPNRVAMVTNVREGIAQRSGVRSRGALPVDFLLGGQSPEEFARRAAADAGDFDPVNLLVADSGSMWWMTNRPQPTAQRVTDGVHGLSNGALDSDWPKVTDGSERMAQLVSADAGAGSSVEPYLDLLADQHRPAADRLPDTGVSAAFEADLSPIFVNMPGYGTRASTVLRVGYDGHGDITERRYGWRGRRRGTTTIRF